MDDRNNRIDYCYLFPQLLFDCFFIQIIHLFSHSKTNEINCYYRINKWIIDTSMDISRKYPLLMRINVTGDSNTVPKNSFARIS